MLIGILTIASIVILASALLLLPWRFPGLDSSARCCGPLWLGTLTGPRFERSLHFWAHLADDVQHGIGVLGHAAIWIVPAIAGQAHVRRVGRVGVAATRV